MYHAEFGVFQGADVVLSEMRSCVNAATTFKYIIGGLKEWTAYGTYAAININNILYMLDYL